MARYSGRDLNVSFLGTTIDTVRSITWSDQADDIDATAAGDTRKNFLAGLVAGTFDVEALDDDADSDVFNALAPQGSGTLIWGPAGTASGKKKYTVTAVVISREQAAPYDNVVTIKSSLRLNALPTVGTW